MTAISASLREIEVTTLRAEKDDLALTLEALRSSPHRASPSAEGGTELEWALEEAAGLRVKLASVCLFMTFYYVMCTFFVRKCEGFGQLIM